MLTRPRADGRHHDSHQGHRAQQHAPPLTRLQRMRCPMLGQQPAPGHIAPQPEGHADGRQAEAVMKAEVVLQQAGKRRAEKAADVHGQIEDGEAGIAHRRHGLVIVQRAEHGVGRRFDAPTAQRHHHQATGQSGHARQHCQCDVAQHHHHAGIEQRALRPPHPVGQPGPQNGGQIDAATIEPDDAARHRLVDAQTAPGGLVVQVDEQDALHPVVGKNAPTARR